MWALNIGLHELVRVAFALAATLIHGVGGMLTRMCGRVIPVSCPIPSGLTWREPIMTLGAFFDQASSH
ncbi:MAG: hypothetical protein IPN03_14790 [Holophagales bacterium]|nr:hypothetical protein [Holophagales bacterium]